MRVLVVEDDQKILESLQTGLIAAGHSVQYTQNGLTALDLILHQTYDFLILDVMLPKLDGIELLKRVRANQIMIPAIFLSAKHTLTERLEGLSAGSDDYITKPFSLQELLMRMEVIARRSKPVPEKVTELSYEDLSIDLLSREVCRGDLKFRLQDREFILLEYFLRNPEQILTKSMILKNVLEYAFEPQTNVVDVFVHRVRSKIDKNQSVKLIQTVRGVGYVLKAH